jgi:branched-chain amino acid transport system ATP-binding protein
MLEVNNLCVWYHKVQALFNVHIHVDEGSFVSVVGTNGSGKTTLLKSLLSLHRNKTGTVDFLNQDISNMEPHQIVSRGISYVPDYRGILKTLTVKENLLIARSNYLTASSFNNKLDHIFELFQSLKNQHAMMAGFLSGGEQQMLAIARALLYRPRLLLIDEPSIGLAPLLVKDIFEKLKGLTKDGMAILMVEQNVTRSLSVSDYCYVIEKGTVVLEGKSSDVAKSDLLASMYFGGGEAL